MGAPLKHHLITTGPSTNSLSQRQTKSTDGRSSQLLVLITVPLLRSSPSPQLPPLSISQDNFVKVDQGAGVGDSSAADSVGYVLAVKVQFPAGCPSIRVDADVDPNFIYTDPSINDNHRIFVFPQTHFSNQFSGPIRSFHYYVSGANYAGCSFTDPAVDVTVSLDNSYIVSTSEAAVIEPLAGWPSGSSY